MLDGFISIHAPAKGATWYMSKHKKSQKNFNPRSREGSDDGATLSPPANVYFNPRSREGSDLQSRSAFRCSSHNFNPRSREGSDEFHCHKHLHSTISIHAPAKGATATANESVFLCKFQSTLPRRERPHRIRWSPKPARFQSTLPRRERRSADRCRPAHPHFNPRSREGSDLTH